MMVKLLTYTPDPEKVVAFSASICWSGKDEEELIEEWEGNVWEDKKIEKLIKKLLESKHMSPLEHCSFTFFVACSRSCSHQLVRHRIASYSQQSQRYTKASEKNFINPTNNKIIDESIKKLFKTYNNLLRDGISKEDARYILPNATKTQLVFTMNARELLHFFELRMCKKAQQEIRKIAYEMKKQVEVIAPTIFNKAGPPCIFQGKCYEKNPCKD